MVFWIAHSFHSSLLPIASSWECWRRQWPLDLYEEQGQLHHLLVIHVQVACYKYRKRPCLFKWHVTTTYKYHTCRNQIALAMTKTVSHRQFVTLSTDTLTGLLSDCLVNLARGHFGLYHSIPMEKEITLLRVIPTMMMMLCDDVLWYSP